MGGAICRFTVLEGNFIVTSAVTENIRRLPNEINVG